MLHFKAGVQAGGMQPEILLALMVVDQQNPTAETFVTSICDSSPKRKSNSRHKVGQAVDIRLLEVKAMMDQWVAKIRYILPLDYDVVLEADHLHVEFDPKVKVTS